MSNTLEKLLDIQTSTVSRLLGSAINPMKAKKEIIKAIQMSERAKGSSPSLLFEAFSRPVFYDIDENMDSVHSAVLQDKCDIKTYSCMLDLAILQIKERNEDN